MSDNTTYSITDDLITIAYACKTIPGFSRLFWAASTKLHEARLAAEERREYEETHATKRGSQYAFLNRQMVAAHEAFVTSIESIGIILEAINSSYEYTTTLEEVSEIVDSMSYEKCFRNSRRY